MKYLLTIYENENYWDGASQADIQALKGEYWAFTESLQKNGNFVAGEALQPTATATTLRVRDGKRLLTDGPFAETKEQLGGFYLVEARDADEAIAMASRIPGARSGCVEVRPVIDFSKQG